MGWPATLWALVREGEEVDGSEVKDHATLAVLLGTDKATVADRKRRHGFVHYPQNDAKIKEAHAFSISHARHFLRICVCQVLLNLLVGMTRKHAYEDGKHLLCRARCYTRSLEYYY